MVTEIWNATEEGRPGSDFLRSKNMSRESIGSIVPNIVVELSFVKGKFEELPK